MESAVIDLLDGYGIRASGSIDAPGVYVGTSKIAALGLRISRGACYHGLALNVDMDLTPFHAIDPCGYPGLSVTQLRDHGVTDSVGRVGEKLARKLVEKLA
jgi:lipoyl(octanoyl) transferase